MRDDSDSYIARLKTVSVGMVLLLLSACASNSAEQVAAGSAAAPEAEGLPSLDPEIFEIDVPDRVFFAFDSYDLDQSDRQTLKRQVAWLKRYPQDIVTVEGHCDERGTREYNLALGARRANSVKNYLVSQGVDPSRITTISYGKERPADPRSMEAAWRVNRRAVTVLHNPDGGSP